MYLDKTESGLPINSYFTEHPQMVLGEITSESTQYGKDALTVIPVAGADLRQQLKEAVGHIHGEIVTPEAEIMEEAADERSAIPADPEVKNFSFTVVDGEIYYRENSVMTKCELSENDAERIRQMTGIRKIMNTLIEKQLEDYPGSAISKLQRELDVAYESLTERFGLINQCEGF